MSKNFTALKGKTIRDSIHGDIFFSNKYLAIIDTPEFQRLRRIHQLSVAYLIFPGAEHTRFSHSIGTYYIMQKIIDHFKPIMKSINLELKERDVDLALVAALVHDIGHGPFSHAFEKVLPNSKDHEQWTIEIILNSESNINTVLRNNFDERFPEDLADIIRKERTVKENGIRIEKNDKIDLFFILSGLISSQLDADRMDYLLRDAKYAGVTFGTIDIERLISSMTLTVNKNNYYVCIIDKYLSDIESYLLARHQMHKEVYLHDVKCEMEIIIKKILERAIYILNNDDTKDTVVRNTVSKPLLRLLQGKHITQKDYTYLDDNVMISTFSEWIQSKDLILNELCSCIINRKKYNRLQILHNTQQEIDEFKEELKSILLRYGYNVDNYNNEYFWLEEAGSYNIYKKKKDNIWILKDDGTINDICDISSIVDERLNGNKTMVFLNYDILNRMVRADNKEVINDVKNLVSIYNNRNHIEIEKKYILDNINVFHKVENVISDLNEYEISCVKKDVLQQDYYYDTDDKYLFYSNKTLRFRKVDNNFQITIKTPTKAATELQAEGNIQNERFEYEVPVNSENKEANKKHIIKYLPELAEDDKWNSLKRTLIISNHRKKINLIKNDVRFEMVFDDVKYINEIGKEKSDYQIEIELKSDYLHRINLKILTDYLEKKVPDLKPMNESKYKRGLVLTE